MYKILTGTKLELINQLVNYAVNKSINWFFYKVKLHLISKEKVSKIIF